MVNVSGAFNPGSSNYPAMKVIRCLLCTALLDTDHLNPMEAGTAALKHHFAAAHADLAVAGVITCKASYWEDGTPVPPPPKPRGERRGDLGGRRADDRLLRLPAPPPPPPAAEGMVSVDGTVPRGMTAVRCMTCSVAGLNPPFAAHGMGDWLFDHVLRHHPDLVATRLELGVHWADGSPQPRPDGPERRAGRGGRRDDDRAVRWQPPPPSPPPPPGPNLSRPTGWTSRRALRTR